MSSIQVRPEGLRLLGEVQARGAVSLEDPKGVGEVGAHRKLGEAQEQIVQAMETKEGIGDGMDNCSSVLVCKFCSYEYFGYLFNDYFHASQVLGTKVAEKL